MSRLIVGLLTASFLLADVSACFAGGFFARRRAAIRGSRGAVVVRAPFTNVVVGRGFNNAVVVGRSRAFIPNNNVVFVNRSHAFVPRNNVVFVQNPVAQQPIYTSQAFASQAYSANGL